MMVRTAGEVAAWTGTRVSLAADVASAALAHTLERMSRIREPHSVGRAAVLSDVIARMSDVDVISFDLYDTLVQRRVQDPRAVHAVVAAEHAELGAPGDWVRERTEAERRARAATAEPDVQLAAIYRQLAGAYSSDLLAAAQAAEIATEVRLTVPTERGRVLWAAAKDTGATLVVTSDIYLPESTISAILHACGYAPDHLVVSGDRGTSKWDGSSYVVLSRLVSGGRVLHIGDNLAVDVHAAAREGVRAVHLPRPDRRADPPPRLRRVITRVAGRRSQPSLASSYLRASFEAWSDSDVARTPAEEIGYGVLGPALAGFADFLHQEAMRLGARRLLFLEREGNILARAYAERHGADQLPSSLAMVSTRLLGQARLTGVVTPDDLEFLTKSSEPLTVEQYVRRAIVISEADLRAAATRVGVDLRTKVYGSAARDTMAPLLDELGDHLAEAGARARPLLESYLRTVGMADPATAIVDVGWRGTIQRGLRELIGGPDLGIYFAVQENAYTESVAGISAWVDARRDDANRRLFYDFFQRVPVLEVLLAHADMGSVVGIETLGPGELAFSHLPLEFSRPDQLLIASIQDAALAFVRDHRDAQGGVAALTGLGHSHEALSELRRLVMRPTLREVQTLRAVRFDSSYGVAPQPLGRWWVPGGLRLGRKLTGVRRHVLRSPQRRGRWA